MAEGRALVHGVISSARGKRIDVCNLRPEDIDETDIAVGLSHKARFGGQTREFYSVAQHSIVVARIVRGMRERYAGGTKLGALSVGRKMVLSGVRRALLHDAAEAYLCDMATPIKALFPEYKALEAKVQAAIDARFGVRIERADQEGYADDVKTADALALVEEARALFPDGIPAWWSIDATLRDTAASVDAAEPLIKGRPASPRFWAEQWLRALEETDDAVLPGQRGTLWSSVPG